MPRRKPLPAKLAEAAEIPGIPNARTWGDQEPPYAREWLAKTDEEIRAEVPAVIGKEHHYLAISGGGQNGAFGAGLLAGWTEAGNRPEFAIVTGISTGALIAPFAFLGPEYDDTLRESYTSVRTRDIVRRRSLTKALSGDAVGSSRPLQALIGKLVTQDVIDGIAAEYRKGRQLWIGTTNLDAGRPVIWDIGMIAASGHPDSADLIRRILLASASIPLVFPPVCIQVEADGRLYDEMHVDGGVTSQIFLYPSQVDWKRFLAKLDVKGVPHVYLIRNSRLASGWRVIKPKLVPIGGRTIETLIRTQGIGDIYRIYLDATTDGLDFNLAYIPDDFDLRADDFFDPNYMKKLYELGYELAKEGYPWEKGPVR